MFDAIKTLQDNLDLMFTSPEATKSTTNELGCSLGRTIAQLKLRSSIRVSRHYACECNCVLGQVGRLDHHYGNRSSIQRPVVNGDRCKDEKRFTARERELDRVTKVAR